MLILRESQLFSHYTPFFSAGGKSKMKIGLKYHNLFFYPASICVGYLTHRLVHFRIRVNGLEDNSSVCTPKKKAL